MSRSENRPNITDTVGRPLLVNTNSTSGLAEHREPGTDDCSGTVRIHLSDVTANASTRRRNVPPTTNNASTRRTNVPSTKVSSDKHDGMNGSTEDVVKDVDRGIRHDENDEDGSAEFGDESEMEFVPVYNIRSRGGSSETETDTPCSDEEDDQVGDTHNVGTRK